MDWWILEVLVTVVLVAIALCLGPFIKRFGKSYAADVFRSNPATGKSFIVLTDVAYYLIFMSYILFTMKFDPPTDWDEHRHGAAAAARAGARRRDPADHRRAARRQPAGPAGHRPAAHAQPAARSADARGRRPRSPGRRDGDVRDVTSDTRRRVTRVRRLRRLLIVRAFIDRLSRPQLVLAGALAGLTWGVLIRLWMRLISTNPEFTWGGTLYILGAATILGVGVGGAAAGRRSPRRWARRVTRVLGGISLIFLSVAAGVILVASVLPATLAFAERRWWMPVRVVLFVLSLLPLERSSASWRRNSRRRRFWWRPRSILAPRRCPDCVAFSKAKSGSSTSMMVLSSCASS